ncbi:MAG: DUF5620 domain-containing protein [Alistipes sp.]|nr:DUF5620 domain-containing protein [Alistipes sp.]
MKIKGFTGKFNAALLSAIVAASTVPAYMSAVPAAAVFQPSLSADSLKGAATALTAGKNLEKNSFPSAFNADNPVTAVVVTVEADRDISFSYGFGIQTSTDWVEKSPTGWDAKGEGTAVSLKKGTNQFVIDLSDLTLKYDQYTKFDFRCYYCSYYDNASAEMVETSVNFVDFQYNIEVDPDIRNPDPDTPEVPDRENIVPDGNKHSNGANSENGKNWSFVDNGDGTATITSTVAKQMGGEAFEPIRLTKGFDEDYYAANPSDDPDKPINSHKFKFSDFGLTDMDGVVVESITCVIESAEEIDQFVYGGGINVQNGSPADTEYAKQVAGIPGKDHAGYWYNDMGSEGEGSVADYEEQGVEFQIAPGNGGRLYEAGTYFEAYWEVPAEVQPYLTDVSTDTVSFQYWYGCDADGNEIDSVDITNAVLTYTKTVTVPYTDCISTAVDSILNHGGTDAQKNLNVSYADLGIDETKDVYAIRFDITAKENIGKLIYNVGTGVEKTVSEDYWFQEEGNYCILDAGDTAEIMWIVPTICAGDESHGNRINTTDGKLNIGYYYGETDAITVDNIHIYYADAPVTTTEPPVTTIATTSTTTSTTTTTTTTTTAPPTTTTTVTTEPPVTTKAPLTVKKWGDANCDNNVDIADATLILQVIGNPDKYSMSEQGEINADVVDNGKGITPLDSLAIQLYDAHLIEYSAFPIHSDQMDS